MQRPTDKVVTFASQVQDVTAVIELSSNEEDACLNKNLQKLSIESNQSSDEGEACAFEDPHKVAAKKVRSKEVVEKFINEYLVAKNVPSESQETVRGLLTNMVNHEAYNNKDYKWSLSDFELGKRLGRGQFGRVYLARERKSGWIVAIKTLLKYEITKCRCEVLVLREIEIQSHLKHPNILQLYTYFHDDHRIYLVTEYAIEGALYQQLTSSKSGRFPEPRAAKYIYQVADALEYCHQNKVIHRDIKPENLLLAWNDEVKLADFGWSVHTQKQKRKTQCGTLDYLAPEMVERKEYSAAIDLWCLGVLLYEFLDGNPPFESNSQVETKERIKNINIFYPRFFSAGAIDLIRKLLVYDPSKRLSLVEVKSHVWTVRNKDRDWRKNGTHPRRSQSS